MKVGDKCTSCFMCPMNISRHPPYGSKTSPWKLHNSVERFSYTYKVSLASA